jgi:hypothetical protein
MSSSMSGPPRKRGNLQLRSTGVPSNPPLARGASTLRAPALMSAQGGSAGTRTTLPVRPTTARPSLPSEIVGPSGSLPHATRVPAAFVVLLGLGPTRCGIRSPIFSMNSPVPLPSHPGRSHSVGTISARQLPL